MDLLDFLWGDTEFSMAESWEVLEKVELRDGKYLTRLLYVRILDYWCQNSPQAYFSGENKAGLDSTTVFIWPLVGFDFTKIKCSQNLFWKLAD